MPQHIKNATVIEAAGNKPKLIEEFIGHVNSQSSDLSIARMTSPAGWVEPAQTPEFDEYTLVLEGAVHIKCAGKEFVIKKNEAFISYKGEKTQYSTPEGAHYIAVCLPAFSPDSVHRDE
ncbi:MAG: cupin [Calditrichaeota bacterium]|nr:MAG: cupin [Calditrichota bacterium]MBL1206068.1 cupin [Calditrichota bacterium]NOG45894.1 cupin [Calditrichota bacterium]